MVEFITIARCDASTDMVDSYYWICKALNESPTNTREYSLELSCAWWRFHLMVYLSKRAYLYVLICAASNIVWNQEQICLQLCLWLCKGGPLHLHHPLKSWYFSHSWYFSCIFFCTVTLLIGYHCIPWWQSTHYGNNITIGIIIYLHYTALLRTTLLLVSCDYVVVLCTLWTSLLLVFREDGTDLPLCCLHSSATCITHIWRGYSSLHTSQLCYLYYAAIVHIFLCFVLISYCSLCTYLVC